MKYRSQALSWTAAKEVHPEDDYDLFVGIDWATEAHEACMLEPTGQMIGRQAVEHSAPDIAALLAHLTGLGHAQPERVAVGIEVPRGALDESLVERGFHVHALTPKQLDRFRDRHIVAGGEG